MATKTAEQEPITTAVAQWDEDLAGMDFESDGSEAIEVRFPSIYLVQTTSKFEGAGKHGGEFWHADREEYSERLRCVVLQMSYGQALFEEGEAAPVCSSADGRVPLPNGSIWDKDTWKPRNRPEEEVPLAIQPEECLPCPFNQWKGDSPPPCGRSILLLLEREDGSFARFRFGGKALKPFQDLVSRRLVYKNRRLPLFAMEMEFWADRQSDGDKTWYQLHIEGTPLPAAKVRHYNAMVADMRGHFAQAAEEAATEARADAAAVSGTDWNDDGKGFEE